MKVQKIEKIKSILDKKIIEYENPAFITNDPISIPHSFSLQQDIEISGFWTAMLAWGNRKTIINKARELFDLMDNAPYDFCLNHQEKDRQRFENFKHRTFNYEDSLYFLEFFQHHYNTSESLESAFFPEEKSFSLKEGLMHFHNYFFSHPDSPKRTRKHVSTPIRKSSCKRLNMFLRWMVRPDEKGVDFGIWKRVGTEKLMVPLDVHVGRVARQLGLLSRNANDWQAVEELTEVLREFDPLDPIKYDFALFSMGLEMS